MRKAQKQEVLDCVGSLHQAHEEIREAIYKNEYGLVQNMLSECQEFAAALGESIERAEGKGHITYIHEVNISHFSQIYSLHGYTFIFQEISRSPKFIGKNTPYCHILSTKYP